MKIITHEQILAMNIDPATSYMWVSEALEQKSSAILPPKISMKPEDGVFCNVMPCILPNGFGGVKLVTRYPSRSPSLDSCLILFDAKTGETLALMDANYITAMRTGAVAAHSVKLFAADGFSTIAVIGLGNTARCALSVISALYPDRSLTVRLLEYKNQHTLFAERFAGYENLTFEYVKTPESAIRGAGVVISAATFFEHDICPDEFFDEGVLVVPIHTRGFTNCDLFFDRVFADDTGHVKGFKYFDRFKSFAEVASVLAGKADGRTNDRERILVYNIGIAMHDVFFASKIYPLAENCEEIDLEPPKTKFWT